MPSDPRDAANAAARVSALKMALHLLSAHGTPGSGQNAAVAWLASEIAHLGGGTVHVCATCKTRPVVVTEPLTRDRVQCYQCRRAARRAAVIAGHRPSMIK